MHQKGFFPGSLASKNCVRRSVKKAASGYYLTAGCFFTRSSWRAYKLPSKFGVLAGAKRTAWLLK